LDQIFRHTNFVGTNKTYNLDPSLTSSEVFVLMKQKGANMLEMLRYAYLSSSSSLYGQIILYE